MTEELDRGKTKEGQLRNILVSYGFSHLLPNPRYIVLGLGVKMGRRK
jgi:hypothetical protein